MDEDQTNTGDVEVTEQELEDYTSQAHDDEDVPTALDAETDDGDGDVNPGESDFQGYATENVEGDDS